MKRTKIKLLTVLFLFASFLFVQDAQAQSFSEYETAALSEKSGIDPADFVSADDATQILKAEIAGLYAAAANLNGGSAEATHSLQLRFYTTILDNLGESGSVADAIGISYSDLVYRSTKIAVGVNVDNIVDGAIDLLSI